MDHISIPRELLIIELGNYLAGQLTRYLAGQLEGKNGRKYFPSICLSCNINCYMGDQKKMERTASSSSRRTGLKTPK
jgi:hypothetical protein